MSQSSEFEVYVCARHGLMSHIESIEYRDEDGVLHEMLSCPMCDAPVSGPVTVVRKADG